MKHRKMRLRREISRGEKKPSTLKERQHRALSKCVSLEGSTPQIMFVTSWVSWFLLKISAQRKRGVMNLWCAQPHSVSHAMGSSGWLQVWGFLAVAYAEMGWEWASLATEGWKLVGGGFGAWG